MMSMKKQRNLYFAYGTCTPDKEFRTIVIDGVPKRMSVREVVKYRKNRKRELKGQGIQESKKVDLKKQKQIQECREYNLRQKAKVDIKDMIDYINRMSTI